MKKIYVKVDTKNGLVKVRRGFFSRDVVQYSSGYYFNQSISAIVEEFKAREVAKFQRELGRSTKSEEKGGK